MNKTPEEEYRVVSVKKGRKGKTSAKSISLSLAEGVNMGGKDTEKWNPYQRLVK